MHDKNEYTSLFDGKTLHGWYAAPRVPIAQYPGGPEPDRTTERYKRALGNTGRWTVEDGVIVGGQEPPGSGIGAFLLSEGTYGDFELDLEAKPDWPVDTGIYIRAHRNGSPAFQVLLDHRKSGGIGGFYGNGIGAFHALPYNFDAEYDANGNAVRLVPESAETTLEPVTEEKKALLSYAAPIEEFLAAWRWADWNRFTIRCVGAYPVLTTWINGVKICELDTGAIRHPHYDRETAYRLLGREGHIAFEVHDNDPRLGNARWRPGAVCRWRNIRLKRMS